MAALAVTAPGPARLIGMLGGHRDNVHLRLVQPQIKLCATSLTETAFYHHSGFDKRRRRNEPNGIVGDAFAIMLGVRFIEKIATIAEVSMTISSEYHFRRSR